MTEKAPRAESLPEVPPEELRGYEVSFFEAKQHENRGSKAEPVERVEISQGSKKVVDRVLSADIHDLEDKFAVKWFGDHADLLKSRGIPAEQANDKYKIDFVRKHWKDGDFDIGREMREPVKGEPDYKREFGDRIDNLLTLKIETLKDSGSSVEAPFLLLNHLQTKIDAKKEELGRLKEGSGEANATAIVGMEGEIRELYSVAKELAERTMKENLAEEAEKSVVADKGFKDKKTAVEEGLEARQSLIKEKKEAELINKELEYFKGLPLDQQRKLFPKLGEPVPGDKLYLAKLRDAMIQRAADNGIEGPAFYALLDQGYKPYEVTKKGGWFRKKTIVMPKANGEELEKPAGEFFIPVEIAGKDYPKLIELQAERELGSEWDVNHERKVNERVEQRIEALAKSPELAEDRIGEVWENARRAVMQEYINRRLKEKPRSKAPAGEGEAPAKDEKIEPKQEQRAGDALKKLFDDASDPKGGLAKFGEGTDKQDDKLLEKFLAERGFESPDVLDIIETMSPERRDNVRKGKNFGSFCGLIVDIIKKLLG